ncbi:MAG: Fe-S cluster assembly ATPase SufC [Acidobacteria bacterium]|nr:Fe-S cluster assembly ATPase SufC [Acidobacteriota bacterium]
MSALVIEGLRAGVEGTELLHGVNLTVPSGEVHALMGPNGSGKSTLSHVLAGRPGYEVLAGSATIDGVELLGLPAWQRARAGLFLAMQYPTAVPGVRLRDMFEASVITRDMDETVLADQITKEMGRIGFEPKFLDRELNVDLSGGEMKRNETLQLSVLSPRFAIVDELDSGLDVDALRLVSERVQSASSDGMGILAITHYTRLFEELRPDRVHILIDGEIVESGDASLADRLEVEGYAQWQPEPPEPEAKPAADPFADPLL